VEAKKELDLCDTLWAYLSPFGTPQVEKAATFNFLLLLVFNVSHQTEADFARSIADHLITYYQSLDLLIN